MIYIFPAVIASYSGLFTAPSIHLSITTSVTRRWDSCLRRLGSLLGLRAPELLLGHGLGLLLGLPDGRDTGDGGLAEVGSVTRLGGLAGNSLVGAVERDR